MDPIPDMSAATSARLEALLRQTREGFLDGLEQIVLRQVDPVLERTKQMMLNSTETLVREQAEPFLGRLRQVLLEALSEAAHCQLEPLAERLHQTTLRVAEEIVQKHATPLVGQLRTALQESMEHVVKRQMDPLLERARQSMQESVHLGTQLADAIIARLKVKVTDPTVELLREEMPRYARWAGRRTLDCVLAATLFCLAAIFLLVGGVLGLQEAGLKPFATYCIGGLTALVAGLVFYRLFMRGGRKEDIPRQESSLR